MAFKSQKRLKKWKYAKLSYRAWPRKNPKQTACDLYTCGGGDNIEVTKCLINNKSISIHWISNQFTRYLKNISFFMHRHRVYPCTGILWPCTQKFSNFYDRSPPKWVKINLKGEFSDLWLIFIIYFLEYKWLVYELYIENFSWNCSDSKIYVHMVFCHQNYSDLQWEKFVLVVEKKTEDWEFAKVLKSLEKVVQTVKGQNNFW